MIDFLKELDEFVKDSYKELKTLKTFNEFIMFFMLATVLLFVICLRGHWVRMLYK